MLLALDLGNGSLCVGIFDGRQLRGSFRVAVADLGELRGRLEAGLGDIGPDAIDRIGLASVNPPWVYVVQEALLGMFAGREPVVIGRDVQVPVPAAVDRPGEVGTDRLLNALAAFDRLHEACLVADFGSALTVDVISEKGEYLGGVIAPGIGMSAAALHAHTALLPHVTPTTAEHVMGRNTIECIRSGLFWSAIGFVEGVVARLRKEYPPAKRVLATGGDAELIAPHCKAIDEVVPELTLEGIRLTLEREGRA